MWESEIIQIMIQAVNPLIDGGRFVVVQEIGAIAADVGGRDVRIKALIQADTAKLGDDAVFR